MSDRNNLKELVKSIVSENYIDAKPQLEHALESTIIDHFKNILVNKETK